MSPDILDVTVVIPVKNEESSIGECLAHLKRFASIVVIDSGSTDRTVEIATAAGAKVLQFEWNGGYPKKRNWFLINHSPATTWVLFLDADELVNDKFCNELMRQTAESIYVGFWLNYRINFLGRGLRYGLCQKKLALLRVGSGLYERIHEENWSTLDMEVHEHPILDGAVGELLQPIRHHDFKTISMFVQRHNEYARWEAMRATHLERMTFEESGRLTRRQRIKYRYIAKWWYPWFYFAYTYFIRLGLLDGAAGFYYAFFKLSYFLTVRLSIKEIKSALR